MQYRRITEVVEGDENERFSSISSLVESKLSKLHPNRGRVFVGPKTPAEADTADEDVTQFKRVHIVAAPDTRHAAAGPREPLTNIESKSNIRTGVRRPRLPSPTETSDDSESVNSTHSGIDTYSIPDDGTPITILTSHLALLPAPYNSIVNATGLGESTLTSIDGDVLSRRVMVKKYRDGRYVTLPISTKEEDAAFREAQR
jgi:hypothetical protein